MQVHSKVAEKARKVLDNYVFLKYPQTDSSLLNAKIKEFMETDSLPNDFLLKIVNKLFCDKSQKNKLVKLLVQKYIKIKDFSLEYFNECPSSKDRFIRCHCFHFFPQINEHNFGVQVEIPHSIFVKVDQGFPTIGPSQ